MDTVVSYMAAREDLANISIMETLYLFGNPANAARLEHSIAQAWRGEFADVKL